MNRKNGLDNIQIQVQSIEELLPKYKNNSSACVVWAVKKREKQFYVFYEKQNHLLNYNNREIQKEIGKQWIFCLFLFRSNSMIFMTTKCSLTLFQCLCIFQYLRHIQHVPAIYRIDNLPTIESIQNYITLKLYLH